MTTSPSTSSSAYCPILELAGPYQYPAGDTSVRVGFYGVDEPQCGRPSGVTTLTVRRAGEAWDSPAPPAGQASGSFTQTGPGPIYAVLEVSGLVPGTAYAWRLTSTGSGISTGQGTFTTGPTPTATPTTTPTSAPTSPAPTSPGATASPSNTSSPVAPACGAVLSVDGRWRGGYRATVTVTGTAGRVGGWRVTWPGAQPTVVVAWNAQVERRAGRVVATNLPWNGNLSAGRSTAFGFVGAGGTPAGQPACTAT